MVKIKITSKEAMNQLDTGNGVIENFEVKRKKDGTVIESEVIIEVSDEEAEQLKELGKKGGFSVSKTR